MKREWILSAAILSFLAVLPAYAEEQEKEKPQETKPAQTQEEHKPADTKKAPKQETKAPKDQPQSKEQQKQGEKSAKQQEQTQKQQKEQDKTQQGVAKQQQQEEKQQKKQQQQVARQQEQQDRNQRQQAGSQQAANGQRSSHIPDDRFRSHFGREHHFRVARQSHNRFSEGGYVFQLTEPWPVGWAYSDDCYIAYLDGEYYLFDLLHPDVRVLVIVVG